MYNNANKLDKLPEDFTFGLELEFTGGLTASETEIIINDLINKGYIRKGWSVHFDRSVIDENGKGAEIVSPILHDDMETKRELEIITTIIKDNGGVMNEKAGGHIHYGLQCLGPDIKSIQNFLKLYTVFEPGCGNYAKPIQRRLVSVVDSKIDSLTELVMRLEASVGANPDHYGMYRYYGLNFQRLIESIRNFPNDMSSEEVLQRLFSGEEVIGKNGKVLSPTVEIRYRNGSSNADEILSAVRMNGQMFVKARDVDFDSDMIIKSMYRNIKNKKNKIFDRVVQSDRENPIYEGLSDEEILMKKFADSEYGDGIVTYNEFNEFISFLYPTMSLKDRIYLYVLYVGKLEATPSITKDDKEIDNGYCMRAA